MIRPFSEWGVSLMRNVDYLCLRNDARFDFLEGDIVNSNGRRVPAAEFENYLEYVQIPYSHAEGYRFSDTGEDYLVGALARLNLNLDLLHSRTQADAAPYLRSSPRTTSTTTTWRRRSRPCTAWTRPSTS